MCFIIDTEDGSVVYCLALNLDIPFMLGQLIYIGTSSWLFSAGYMKRKYIVVIHY